jgi:hypothetical protein
VPKITIVLLLAAVAACARAYPPPGGERDVQPPRLIGTTPEPLEVVAPSSSPVVLRFDERLSERSPLDGALRVERRGSEVRIGIDGGWRPDRVYRVVLLPGFRDLFGNEREEAIELVFSTGPEIPQTAIAGIVLDRITGRSAVNPVVEAVRLADTVRYMAVADSGGFYALRHLPLGEYMLRAYADANRNRRREYTEPLDSGQVASLAETADTVPRIFHVLAPDTSAPQVRGAAAIDSLHVRVTTDDYIDADDVAAARADVLLLPDSTAYATATAAVLEAVFTEQRRREAAAADTAAEPPRPQPAAPAEALPAREIVFTLDRPLAPGSYVIVVRGLVNLHGLTGGGADDFEVAAVAPAPVDTAQVGGRR